MYGSFEGWLQTNGYPWESYEESKARYRSLYGEDEEIEVAETPAYTYEPEPEPEEEGFLDSFLGGSEYLPSLSEFGSAAAKSWDETQASGATIAETMVAPALDWMGSFKEGEQRAEKYADDIREWAPGYREEQLAEAAQYPEVQTRLQKRLAEDPNYTPAETREQTLARLQAEGSEWYDIAKHVPEWIPLTLDKAVEDAPTAGEVGSFATGSAVPMVGAAAVGLPLAIVGAPITAAVGAMGTGALMSSLLVSSETAENIKNNPVVRRALEIDDETPFEDLPPVKQQSIMKVAEDGAQSNLGQRLISSGIPEMLGYIPAGGWLLRSLTDIAGGTASEVWDISVSRESMISALLENGVDPNKASELDAALEAIGPKKSEVFMKALVGEAVATGPITAAEEMIKSSFKPRDYRVNVHDTETKELQTRNEDLEKEEIKIKTNQAKSLLDKKAKRQNQVDDLVDLWKVDPDGATQELEDFKLNDRKVQNDIQDILSVEHPEVLRDIVTRIGDADRAKELETALEKADKEAQKRAEKEQGEFKKAEDQVIKDETKRTEVADAKKAIKEYEAERPAMISALAKDKITQEQFDEWDQLSRPIDAYKIAKKYDDSVQAEVDAKVKKDEEAKTKAATDLANKQAEELNKAAEEGAKEDTDLEELKKNTVVGGDPNGKGAMTWMLDDGTRYKHRFKIGEGYKESDLPINVQEQIARDKERNEKRERQKAIRNKLKEKLITKKEAELQSKETPEETEQRHLKNPKLKKRIDDAQAKFDNRERSSKPIKITPKKTKEDLKAAEAKRKKAKETVEATPEAEPTPVETTAPATLIDRYNNALRNPEGSLRITIPDINKNKDKTIKNVSYEWDGGSDTFTRAELQELGAIQKKDGKESYVAVKDLESKSIEKTTPEVKVETKTETTPKTKAPKKAKEADFTKVEDNLGDLLSDEGAESVINLVGDERIPVRSVYTEDVPGRLSVLDESYPDGMTAQDMVIEEMDRVEEKNRIKNEPINEKIATENEKREAAGKPPKDLKEDTLTAAQEETATNRGQKNFAKAVAKIQSEQIAVKKKAKQTTKPPPKKEIVGVNAAMDQAAEAFKKKNPEATPRELQNEAEKARIQYHKDNPIEKDAEKEATNLIETKEEGETKTFKTLSEGEEEFNNYVDNYVKKKAKAYSSIKKKGEKKKQKPTAKLLETWEEEATNSYLNKDVKKSVVPEDSVIKIIERATGPESIYTLKKDEAKKLVDSFVSNTKLKDKDVDIRVFSKEDDADIKALNELMGEEQATEVLETSEGFVAGGKTIGIIAENIRGRVASARPIAGGKSAAGRLVNTLFHEIIGHYGLKKLLGDKYKTFINRFIKSNKKTLEEYAMGKSGMDYLPESVREIKSLESRRSAYNALENKSEVEFIIAEEYIARNFAEFGARDPNIINRIVASLRDYISSIPMFEDMGITTNQVKKIMTELQQEYIGGKRNFKTFIFGEDFRTLPDTQLDTTEEEEVKAEGAPEAEVDDGIEVLTLDDKKATTDKTVNMSKRTKPDPEKTIKAYKLFQTKKKQPGKLFPLFLGATESVPTGEWQDADIQSKKGFAPRPGWHLSDLPFALHIGTFMNKFSKPTVRPDNQVWAEVEVSADVDWQPEANKRAKKYSKSHKMAGQINPKTADIKNEVPVDGNYRYKTNPNMKGEWIIAGSIKVNRILSDSEVKSINDKAGVADLPRKGQKVNMSKKPITFEEELQKAKVKIDSVPFVRAAEKRREEADKVNAMRKTNAERAGVAYRVNVSDEAVKKYLDSKAEEAPSMVGVMRLPNMSKMPKKLASELKGEIAVGMLADRLIRGQYKPVHKNSLINIFLGGGPLYAFDKSKKNVNKNGRAVWASEPQSTTKVVNAIKRTGAKYGYILVGKDDMHLSNLDVWDVATQEALDSVKFDGATLESLDQSAREVIDNMSAQLDGKTKEVKHPSVKALQGKIKTFKELMAQGDNLSFDARKPILNYIFGVMRAKKNSHININTIKDRTSQYPNSEAGDLIGILKFHSDKSNFRTTADELGVEKHRSYSSILQGEGVHKFKTPIPLKEYGREWLMEKRRSYNEQGKLVGFQRPFWGKGQVDFEDNLIYSAEFISYITGEKVTSGDFKGKIITKKPSKDKRTKIRGATATKSGALRSIDYKSPTFDIDLIPTEKFTVNMSKRAEMQSYRAADTAIGRLSDEGLYWMPTFKAQDKLAHKLTRRLIAQGTLPDMELYRDIRKKNKGVVFQAQQAGEKLFKILSKSKQQKALYNYFVTKNADSNLITNPKEREAAVSAKKQIMQIGRDLVERGLMTQESLDKFDDQYLPRKYLKYLLRDKDYRAIDQGGAGVNVDLGYTAKRKDIPEGIRELILGEVKDPAFLSSIAISTPIRDMAILDMFEQVASNPNWVLPKTLVKFDIVGELKRLSNNDTELIEALQLYNTGGNVKISGHWLMNEAERIRELVDNHMVLDDKREKLVRKLINTMTNKGKEIVGEVIPSDYKKIPKGRKYGRLQGMAVRKEIFEDLFGWGTNNSSFDVNADGTIDASWAEKVLGTGGTFEQYNRLWKWSKVSANPPSWVRNFVSNLVFMSLGPVPIPRLPDLFVRALNDQIKTRKVEKFGTQKEFDALKTHTKIADEMGLTSGGFSQAELKTIRNQFVSSKVKDAGILSLVGIRNAFKGFQRGTSDVYGGIDTLGKVMMVKYLMDSKGASKEVAAAQAEKYLFDYSNPLPSVKYLRKSAFGAPFLSYPSFVAPVLIETIIKRPWKFAPYIFMGHIIKNMFKEEQDISDEEYEAVMGTLSDYLRKRANEKADLSWIPESVLPLPHKDSLGRAQVVDIGYYFPWGMFTEVFRQLNPFSEDGSQITGAMHSVGLMGAPLLNMAVTSLTGRDPFTDRQIHDEFATAGEKYSSWFNYAFNLTLPPMFHGLSPVGGQYSAVGKNPEAGGFGALTRLHEAYNNKVGREGEPKFTEAQAWLRMVGLNITPLAPFEARGKQVRYEVQKIKGLQRALKIKYQKGLQAQYSKKELNNLVKNEVERINRLVEKLNKRVSKKLPASLKRSKMDILRSREKYLRYLKAQKAG